MAGCCEIEQIQAKKRVLVSVLIINAFTFVIQFTAAWVGHSTALLADSLDMLGDVTAYGVSLYAAGKDQRWLAKAALFKGLIILFFGLIVAGEIIYKLVVPELMPKAHIMLIFSIIGLIANGTCFYLLTRHRKKDINMRSTWICSRNDIIGNVSVLITSGLVMIFKSRWPDIIVGASLATVLISSAIKIIKSSMKQLANK